MSEAIRTKRTFLDTSAKARDALGALKDVLKVNNKTAFLIAMSWGFRNRMCADGFKKHGAGWVRIEYLRPEDLALMAALQYAESGTDSLIDHEARLDLAERYAEGGALLLGQQLAQPEDFRKWLAGQVKQILGSVPAGSAPGADDDG
jgi:hypothetical protein